MVSFLESLWGNFYDFHEKYIEFSCKETLKLTMKINLIFSHEEESNQKILKRLEKI